MRDREREREKERERERKREREKLERGKKRERVRESSTFLQFSLIVSVCGAASWTMLGNAERERWRRAKDRE
jgi:hypothetical protein